MNDEFRCRWCTAARGVLPTNILICPSCDVPTDGSQFPNQHLIQPIRRRP